MRCDPAASPCHPATPMVQFCRSGIRMQVLKAALRQIAPLAALAGLAASCGCADALAASGPWQKADFVEARLVSAVDGVGKLDAVPVGLELHLKDGWKTYWRSPGDAGLPPVLDWAASHNVKSATLAFPVPHRFEVLKQQTFGYKDSVVFPIRLVPVEPGRAVDLKVNVDVLVCAHICVPQSLELTLKVGDDAASPGAEAQLINKFQALVPRVGEQRDLKVTGASAADDGSHQTLSITAAGMDPLTAPDVFVEVEPPVAFDPPRTALSADGRQATFLLTPKLPLPVGATLAGRTVTVTVVSGDQATEQSTTITAGAQPSVTTWLASNIAMIGIALLGGLILNLMPCVLPVLSIKLMSVVSHGHAPPAHVRANFLATAVGVVFSLMLLAISLIALKSAGHAIGWGTQFQQPVFVTAMAVIVTLFAANMWGLFEFILPASVSQVAGSAASDDSSLLSNFVVGAFATLLATPCSAPFVGTAVGFALSGGTVQILSIFFALGLGLASPYLAVAAFPSLARLMPRPGLWMVRLRQVLSLGLGGTVLWLLSVLPDQIGLTGTVMIAALLLALLALLVVTRERQHDPQNWSRAASAGLCAVAIGLPLVLAPPAARNADVENGGIAWVTFDRDQIKSLVSQGKTVFVDVTASWCVVCKSNKRLVINTAVVKQRLEASAIAMRADWTLPDPKISTFLASYGRYGIPLNVVFGPAATGGILLPELLTISALFEAIDKASGKTAAVNRPAATIVASSGGYASTQPAQGP